MAAKKTKPSFREKDHIVYPAHGVGRVTAIEKQTVAGMSLELYVIDFEHEKMTLRVPLAKATSVGMRPLADKETLAKVYETIKGRARVKRTMWSRRAQEYEAKINSGDLIAVSEVVRDLYRSADQPEPSYSERQLYETAIERMGREVAAIEGLSQTEAVRKIERTIDESPKRRKAAAEAAEAAEAAAAAAEQEKAA